MTLRVAEIVMDCADHGAVVDFWVAALGDYTRRDPVGQYVAIVPSERAIGRPVILFQMVPEPRTVKNRVHLDLRGESMAEEVERLRSLGATFIAECTLGATSITERSMGAIRWTVMADPEGNEFCVAGDG